MLPVEKNKIKASIIVIGFSKEDHKMYPHFYDFMQNLRDLYDEVIYVEDGDRGGGLYLIDYIIRNILDILNFKRMFRKILTELIKYSSKIRRKKDVNLKRDENFDDKSDLKTTFSVKKYSLRRFCNLFIRLFLYVSKQRKLIKNLKNVKLKYDEGFVLAIDHTSCFTAERYFPGKVIFWSSDILTKDCSMRIKKGFLEKLITSKDALKAKVLIIQDEQRKKVLEESVGASFPNTIYLPVSLNDSEFCRKASEDRLKRDSFSTVNIIQSGSIIKSRWSDQLIDVYQNWPTWYKLNLHGCIGVDIKNKLLNVKRSPSVSEFIYDNTYFPQFLNNYDIGFVGYAGKDSNHKYIENASAQMVEFLRLGIPVIGCGPFLSNDLFKDFVNKQNIGKGISSPEEMEEAIKKIIDNYSFFSYNARKLYELRFNLNNIFNNYLIKDFEKMCMVKSK